MEYFNIELFDKLTGAMYAPAYSIIARQIVERTGITTGHCLDIGTGCGYMAIALAHITQLHITALDIAPRAIEMAAKNIAREALAERIQTALGDVHRLPLRDQSMQLVVSRASISFWKEITPALREIHRVLAPGGYAYLGGGFGNDELCAEVQKKRRSLDVDWTELTHLQVQKYTPETLATAAAEAGMNEVEIRTSGGLWLIAHKPVPMGAKL